MSVQKLKAHLAAKSENELIKEITMLYQQFSVVKDFYTVQMSADGEREVFTKHKKIIQEQFFPQRGLGKKLRLSVARKAVMDFKKLNGLNEYLIDLAFFYVEIGIEFSNTYGGIDEAFYSSMESMFEQAMKWMQQCHLNQDFQERAHQICKDTRHIGWGFHEILCDIYDTYFDGRNF